MKVLNYFKSWQLPEILLFFLFSLGVLFRFSYDPFIVEWITRDFERSIRIFEDGILPLIGSEKHEGGYLHGPFLYYILSPLYFISASPNILYIFYKALNIFLILVLYFSIKPFVSKFSAYLAVILFTFHPSYVAFSGSPINPSFLFPFNILLIYLTFSVFIHQKKYLFIFIIPLLLAVSQIHFSFLIFSLPLLYLAKSYKIPLKTFIFSLSFGTLTLLPYAFYLWTIHGFPLHYLYKTENYIRSIPKDVFSLKALNNLTGLSSILKQGLFGNENIFIRISEMFNSKFALSSSTVHQIATFLYISKYYILFVVMVLFIFSFIYFTIFKIKIFKIQSSQEPWKISSILFIPIFVIWQLSSIGAYSHPWYSYLFYPIFQLWMALTLEQILLTLPAKYKVIFKYCAFLFVFLWIPHSVFRNAKLTNGTNYFKYHEVMKDLKEVHNNLNLTMDEFRENVFFINWQANPFRGWNELTKTNNLYGDIEWNIYIDFLYQDYAAKSPTSLNDKLQKTCYIITHKRSLDKNTENEINDFVFKTFNVSINAIEKNERLLYIKYLIPNDDNCYHNTRNNWLKYEEQLYLLKFLKPGQQSANYINSEKFDSQNIKSLHKSFIIWDEISLNPFTLELKCKVNNKNSLCDIMLKNGVLMGPMKYWKKYSDRTEVFIFEDLKLNWVSESGEQSFNLWPDKKIGFLYNAPLQAYKMNLVDISQQGKLILTYKSSIISIEKSDTTPINPPQILESKINNILLIDNNH